VTGARVRGKWTEKLFFQLLNITKTNSYTILSTYNSKTDHMTFCVVSVQNLLAMGAIHFQRKTKPTSQSIDISNIGWLQDCVCGDVCTAHHKLATTKFQCTKYKVSLYLQL
jgi:hypothetical protein